MSAKSEAIERAATIRFAADRATWVDALTTVGLAIDPGSNLPVLGGVLMEGHRGDLVLSGYDYETAISVRIPGAAHTPGRLVVDHAELSKLLGAVVKGTPKRTADTLMVSIEATDPGAPVLSLGGYTVPVTAYPVKNYPELPVAGSPVTYVDRDRFCAELTRVLPAVSKDETLPAFSGVLITVDAGAVVMVGTDRYRLAFTRVPALSTADREFYLEELVSGRLLRKVVKLLPPGRVGIGTGQANGWPLLSLTCGTVEITTRPLGCTFPDYRPFMPTIAASTVTVDRAELLTRTQRAAAIVASKGERPGCVTLAVSAQTLTVAPQLPNAEALGAPSMPALLHGKDARFIFNPAYLIDALHTFTTDTVTLHLPDEPGRLVLLTNTPQGIRDPRAFRHLVMPIRPKPDTA